jgi:uncharacterized membrane protein YcjF (UPF0283 family)
MEGLDMTGPAPADPVVTYTVRELILRMDAKLDTYAGTQRELQESVRRLVPAVDDQERRLKTLEVASLARVAVRSWQSNLWRGVVSVSGLLAAIAVVIELIHYVK